MENLLFLGVPILKHFRVYPIILLSKNFENNALWDCASQLFFSTALFNDLSTRPVLIQPSPSQTHNKN